MAQCEDWPCCGHELNDCDGTLYGSDASIQSDPHLLCDHENGECAVAEAEQDEADGEPWSVTDDFVDPNRQPAGDQEPW